MLARVRSWPRRPELLILTALSALTRFWGLFQPRAVVFDEVHYEKFTAEYLARVFYLDVHPPLANQIFALTARLFGIPYLSLGRPEPEPLLRIVPALAGTLIIPVFYLFLRRLGAPRRLATLGGALLLLDNALLAESRVIVPDSMLVLFALTALTVYLAARRRSGAARWLVLAAAALCAGLAVSIKWTGLSALGLILLAWGVEGIRRRAPWRRLTAEGAMLVAIPVAVYLSVFAVHFARMTRGGPGDMWMSAAFRATLQGDATYTPGAHMAFLDKFFEINRAMRRSDAALVGTANVGASPWYSWPVIRHAMTFWAGESQPDGRRATIFLAGNPVVWYGILVGFGVIGVAWLRRRDRFAAWRAPLALTAVAYVANFLPFALIQRVMYQYSYFMAFVYSLAFAVLGVGIVAGWAADGDDSRPWAFPSRRSAALYWGLIALAAVSFLYYAPVTYGWPLTPQAFQMRFWLVQRHF